MGKYEGSIAQFKDKFNTSKRVLITLPQAFNVDKLASALSLMLALKLSGKEALVVTSGSPLVAHSNLFGVGEVKDSIPAENSGNYVVSIEGVVDNSTGTPQITSLEKLDYFPEGNALNLVFHTLPGASFNPTNITSGFKSNDFDLIFIIGAASFNDLGNIYAQNQARFSTIQSINIDNNQANTNFATYNVLDQASGSISEMVMGIMTDLNLNLDADTASNILAGIYEATLNLTSKMTPETYIAVGTAMQKGGNVTPQAPVAEIPVVQAAPQSAPVAASAPVSPVSDGQVVASAPQQGFDLRQVFNLPSDAAVASPGIVSANLADTDPNAPVSSPEERPMGEQVSSPIEAESTPTPDWLVPKIYKGGSTS